MLPEVRLPLSSPVWKKTPSLKISLLLTRQYRTENQLFRHDKHAFWSRMFFGAVYPETRVVVVDSLIFWLQRSLNRAYAE